MPEPSKEALKIAANVWTRPETRQIEFDSRLATAFAHVLDELNMTNQLEAKVEKGSI